MRPRTTPKAGSAALQHSNLLLTGNAMHRNTLHLLIALSFAAMPLACDKAADTKTDEKKTDAKDAKKDDKKEEKKGEEKKEGGW